MLVAIDAVGIREHGGAAVLCEMLRWLPRARPAWRWHVFVLERHAREYEDPPIMPGSTLEAVSGASSGLGRLWWIYAKLPRRARELKADVLLSFANISPPIDVPRVVFLQQPLAVFPEMATDHGLLCRLRLWCMRYLFFVGAARSEAVIVQTEMMRRRLLQLSPRLKDKIIVVPSGYRVPSSCPRIRSDKRSMIDGASRPRLVYISAPRPHKNHITVVQALPRILEAFPSASLLLTIARRSEGDRAFEGVVRRIESVAQSLHVDDRIYMLGQLTADEVAHALGVCDLQVFPSVAESFGLPLVEAMAAGCANVVSDLPYARDVAGDAAVYFDARDDKALADTVIKVLSDPELMKSKKDAGVRRSARFCYEDICESISRVLAKAVNSQHGRVYTEPV